MKDSKNNPNPNSINKNKSYIIPEFGFCNHSYIIRSDEVKNICIFLTNYILSLLIYKCFGHFFGVVELRPLCRDPYFLLLKNELSKLKSKLMLFNKKKATFERWFLYKCNKKFFEFERFMSWQVHRVNVQLKFIIKNVTGKTGNVGG
jgi:hypothetical protein